MVFLLCTTSQEMRYSSWRGSPIPAGLLPWTSLLMLIVGFVCEKTATLLFNTDGHPQHRSSSTHSCGQPLGPIPLHIGGPFSHPSWGVTLPVIVLVESKTIGPASRAR